MATAVPASCPTRALDGDDLGVGDDDDDNYEDDDDDDHKAVQSV